jgi:hypothetical protein
LVYRRNAWFLIVLLLVSAISVSAFTVEYEAEENKIMKEGTAKFKIIVHNDAAITDKFRISTRDYQWDISTDPLSDYYSGFFVAGETKKTVNLFLRPYQSLFYGNYRVNLDVVSQNTGKTIGLYLPIDVKSPYPTAPGEYVPLILLTGDVNGNGKMDPRYQSSLRITLDNRNILNHTNLSIDINSEFINRRIQTSLLPLEKKSLEFKFVLEPTTLPSNKTITVTVVRENKTVLNSPITIPVEIIPYSEIKKEENVKNKWFKYEKSISLFNDGNVEHQEKIKLETSSFKAMFTSTSPRADVVKEQGVKYFVWDVAQIPQGVVTINMVVNYRPIFYMLFTILLVSTLYYLLRSPLVAKKQAINIKLYEGGISEMKILIHLKNRTQNTYSGLVVGERIPKIADYLASDSMGNILPSKVLRHEKKGTMLKWNIDNLDPFEERIIIYKLKAKLTILGQFILPATIIKFKDDANSEYVVHSNKLKMTNLGKENQEE